LRKLFPTINARLIYNGESLTQPAELDFSQDIKFPYLWGMPSQKLLEVEGDPLDREKSGETETFSTREKLPTAAVWWSTSS